MSEIIANQHGEVSQLTQPNAFPASIDPDNYDEIEKRLAEIQKIDHEDKPKAGILYWEAAKGDSIKGIFAGWTILNKKQDNGDEIELEAAVVRVSTSLCYMSASVKFINAFRSLSIGRAVYVECTGTKANSPKDFDVRVLD